MMSNDDHSSHGAIPAEIADNLNEFCPEFRDLNYEEVLQHQESVYQSLQGSIRNEGRSPYYGQSSDWSQFSAEDGESSRCRSFDSQLEMDEALARSLQHLELEDNFDNLNISESTTTATENGEGSSRETHVSDVTPINQNLREDDVDPDNMTYEQLQFLGESVGSENRGLSEEIISRLLTFKYKAGKKKETKECVICCMMFKNGENLIALPCTHQYHSECITPWLRLNKTCPICQKEVTED